MDHLPIDDTAAADDLEGSVRALICASAETNRYIKAVEDQLRGRTRAIWGAIAVGAALILVLVAAAVMVSVKFDRRIEDNNRRWCPVVLPLAPRPGDPPPQGSPEQVQRALRIRVAFDHLVDDFGCR